MKVGTKVDGTKVDGTKVDGMRVDGTELAGTELAGMTVARRRRIRPVPGLARVAVFATMSCALLLCVMLSFAMASRAVAAPSPAKRGAAAAKVGSPDRQASAVAKRQVRARVGYAPRAYGVTSGRRTVFADLVGDPESGYGFYPLPPEIQRGAARYRATHRRSWRQNPVLSAMAADAIRNPCFIPADKAYRCGVYNPIEGVGTPFFAGYYR